ncbi:MAG: type II secretion system F family protein [Bacteriovoracaceae bacterium]|jgi:tight adherence protein B|nr:type II secretion system F family protein [Bacteriovoracaceae bacterium]
MNKSFLVLTLFPVLLFAQAKESNFNFLTDVFGKMGVAVAIGLIFFLYTYRNAVKLFDWIEDQTYGTRDYILTKLELLHIEIEPNRITYILLFMSVGLSILVIGIFALMGKIILGLFLGGVLSVIGWKSPRKIMDFLVERRIKAYSFQMTDALQLLSNGLRAGLSVPQSIGMVVDELPPPISQEFNTILQQTKIGVPLEEAFDNLVERVPTDDNQMFVSSVNILRETGGNLAEVFDTICDVIRERVKLLQKIDTMTAQGKFQGIIIGCMPFALFGVFAAGDPTLAPRMFSHPAGIVIFTAACILDFIGLFLIFKIIKIKV